jgi:hypothetical protein
VCLKKGEPRYSIPRGVRGRCKNTSRRHGEAVQVTLLFLMLLAVFFWRAIFLGRKLVPGDIIYSDPVYYGYAPSGLARANNTLLYDEVYQFYPWRVYTVQALQQGFLPWWNPYVYSGAPFVAADQPAVFYPLNVLTYVLSGADAALATALARLLIAGLATYWFLRAIGAGRFGALLGGISYAFGGFMVVFLGHPHTNVAAWLPALFLTLEWLYRKNDGQHVALVALVTAAQLTGGHAELCLYTLTAGALYYLFRVVSARCSTPRTLRGWWGRRPLASSAVSTHPAKNTSRLASVGHGERPERGCSSDRRNAGWSADPAPDGGRSTEKPWKAMAPHILSFSVAMIAGFALAAIQWLPFLEWLQQNAELDLRLATKGAQVVRVGVRHWLAGLPLMILPNLFGNPTWPSAAQSFLPFWNFAEQTLYVGIIAWAMAVGGAIASFARVEVRTPRQTLPTTQGGVPERGVEYRTTSGQGGGTGQRWQKHVLFMSALALTALGMALRWPVFDWVNQLPLFSIAASGRLRLIYTFSVSVLAGLGASRLSDSDVESALARRVRWLLMALAALSVAALVFMRWALDRALTGSAVVGFGEALAAQELSAEAVRWAFGLTNLNMYWPVLIAFTAFVVLTLYQRRVLRRRVMQALVLLLVVVDLFAFGIDYHTTVREELIFPETPALELLQSDDSLFRVVGTNIDFMPNSSMMYGLQDVRGLDFPDRRYLLLCQAIGGQDRLGYGIVFTEQLQPRLLGLMNVKYVLTSSNLDEKVLSNLTLLAVDKDVRIYQNRSFLPRSFVVHRARIVDDAQEALAVLQAPDLDLSDEIVLEEAPPPGFEASLQTAAQATTEITRYDPNHVTVQASTSVDGFLFLSDRYDPGWKAYVDGVGTEVYRADYVFRAVYLKAGQHRVDFVYAPRSFALALPISLLAALGLLLLLASPWLQRLWMRVGRGLRRSNSMPHQQTRETVGHDTP